MSKTWKDRPGKNYKQQKHHKKEREWNTKNHISVRKEREFEKIQLDYDPVDSFQ